LFKTHDDNLDHTFLYLVSRTRRLEKTAKKQNKNKILFLGYLSRSPISRTEKMEQKFFIYFYFFTECRSEIPGC
jgi:hypothetical protein